MQMLMVLALAVCAQAAGRQASAPIALPSTMLFVCTGNTCRSPMAERAFNDIGKRQGQSGIVAISRGLNDKGPGVPMSAGSRQVLSERGIAADGHQARLISEEDARNASVILAMDRSNVAQIALRFPAAADKTFLLKEYAGTGVGDVPNPYGQPVEAYRNAGQEIFEAVDGLWEKIKTQPRSP